GAPAVKEIKPTAAIAWKRIAKGPIMTRGEPMPLYDAAKPVGLSEALDAGDAAWSQLDGHLDSVYIDAGENGQFSRDEFETISALGMMELVT
ncbi:MAG: short-chain dehydrogenase, partial [Gemmatimonadetes bacterium]|nr:short-chain dehydrogenase [Gemmatimonadota bacterium]NIS02404.1 short-chain dehydrogenase [Gemmatimonadota bacterium]NIT68308.1 short-chain dehydrogenase [Gemmatimonadota bacterium]NIU54775.1 short-chain dehydrogenase [Gemmatimonadota bacterium]NIV24880.1 short-chain dehydrogenase [Gemmatimonadota bacterium]